MRNIIIHFFLLGLIITAFSSNAQAEGRTVGPLKLTKEISEIDLLPYARVYKDMDGVLDFETVNAKSPELFLPHKGNEINFGFDQSALWVKFELEKADDYKGEWYMDIAWPSLDNVECYLLEDNGTLHYHKMGDLLPFDERPLDFRNFVVPFQMLNTQKMTVMLRVQTEGSLMVPIKLFRSDAFIGKQLRLDLSWGLFTGIILIMVCYSMLMYFLYRDLNYLLYIVPVVTNSTFLLSISGHLFQYIYPWSPLLANKVTVLSIGAWIFSSSLFAVRFLNVKQKSPRSYQMLVGMVVIGGLSIILGLVANYSIAIKVVGWGTSLNSIVILLSAMISWNKGHKPARYFVLAWGLYLIGAVVYVLFNAGFLPDNVFTNTALPIGTVIEVLMLSFALSDKNKLFESGKGKNLEDMIKTQSKVTLVLEEKLKENTRQLSEKQQLIHQKEQFIEEQEKQLHELKESLFEKESEVLNEKESKLKVETKATKLKRELDKGKEVAALVQSSIAAGFQNLNAFESSFVLNIPKNEIGGDFCWNHTMPDNKRIVVVADISGDGLEGALTTLFVERILKEIVLVDGCSLSGEILTRLNQSIIKHAAVEPAWQNLIMTACVVVYDIEGNMLEYAGAKQPLIYIKDGKLYLLKGERTYIGYHAEKEEFKTKKIKIDNTMACYLFTNGYANQLSGETGRRITSKRLRELFFLMKDKPMKVQQHTLENVLHKWRTGKLKKEPITDDIMVVGFQLKP
ncbi:7TM diverse intracellular signaling domain-containing protein [Limibacter armeniacum]|uniref:7TM diverse intracellular signaling domain-containing protein n=1 Tax=Limibacter armeniacum TaxID=466084 RepID=UPI002FE5E978